MCDNLSGVHLFNALFPLLYFLSLCNGRVLNFQIKMLSRTLYGTIIFRLQWMDVCACGTVALKQFLLFDLSPQILLVTYISVWPLFHSVNVVYTMCIRIRVMNGKMWENFCVTTQMTSLLNPSISLDMIFYVNEMIFIFTDWYSNYVRFDFYRLIEPRPCTESQEIRSNDLIIS